MFKRIKQFLAGILLIAFALWLCSGANPAQDQAISRLATLPDHDYIPEIRALMKQQRWGEARVLCEDLIRSELPGSGQAWELKVICDQQSGKIGNRLYKAGKGFITGSPDGSIEELGGSVISDMIMYGDIRDLAVQGYYRLTGKETDPVIASLAAVGLITEFIDWADWAPAALKAFRKAGVMTDTLSRHILRITKEILSVGKITPAGKAFFGNLQTLLRKAGFIRTGSLIKFAKTPADVAKMAESAKAMPHLTHLVARNTKEHAGKFIDMASVRKDRSSFMKLLARKGPRAVRILARSGKIVHKGHLKTLLQNILGTYIYWVGLFTGLTGLLLITLSAAPKGTLSKLFRRKKISFNKKNEVLIHTLMGETVPPEDYKATEKNKKNEAPIPTLMGLPVPPDHHERKRKKRKNKKNENKISILHTMGICSPPEDLKEQWTHKENKTFSEILESEAVRQGNTKPLRPRKSLREKIFKKWTGEK